MTTNPYFTGTNTWPLTTPPPQSGNVSYISTNTTGYPSNSNTWVNSFNTTTPTEVDLKLKELINTIELLSKEKLDASGVVFKRTFERYKALDNAHNILREIGMYDDLLDAQETLWEKLAPKVGYKKYDIRDAIWDILAATIVKNDISVEDFLILSLPYGVTIISER